MQSIIGYNDVSAQIKKSFDYDAYGNVTDQREYGYQQSGSWVVRRRTHLTYKTDTAYLNAYLRNLVTQVEVLDALNNASDTDDVVVAKSSTTYDDYNAMGGMENYSGTAAPPGHLASYDTTKTVRGNATGTTEWSDIAGNISTTRNNKRDIFGNVVKAQVSCCSEKSFTFTEDTYWSSPSSQTDGPLTGVPLTSSATYDFNTSVTKTAIDPNNQTATYSYDAALRNTATTLPTGAVSGVNYYDNTLSSSSYKDYWEEGVHKIITTSSKRDGWSRTIEEVNPHNGQVNTSYDAMGRILSVTNPFTANGSPSSYVTSYQYDSLGRPTSVTLPDGNTILNNYNGATVTIIDQVNRKIKRENDGLGRLVKVTEQDASGNLTLETTYTYNVLNKLTEVNQGGQTRAWKYDGLGRTLFEKIPEQTPTISETLGGTPQWTAKYLYTDFDALSEKKDANGTVASFAYDALHRLTGISYNTSGASNVAATGAVTYTYDTDQSSSTNGLLLSTKVSNSNGIGYAHQESYAYEGFDRVSAITYTIDNKTYTTDYEYNQVSQKNRVGHIYFQFDGQGHIAAVRNGPTGNGISYLSNAIYDLKGSLVSDSLNTNGTTVNETFGYDAQRLQQINHTASKGATSLMNLTYSYNATSGQNGGGTTAGNAGQVMSISGSINSTPESVAYTYNNLSALATSNQTTNGVTAQRRFVYDRWGNRTGIWDQTSGGTQIQIIALEQSSNIPTNRISAHNTQGSYATFVYDANGNVTNDGVHTYTYDAENRVVNVDSGFTASYAYDSRNRRVKKVAGGSTRHYIWDGSQVIAEHNGSTSAVLVQYFYLRSRMVAKVDSGTPYFFLSDKLSTRVVLDINGNVVGRQAHLPFGEELAGTSTQDKHHFTSYESDSENGTHYAMNRSYSHSVGRFDQADPFVPSADNSIPQSWNRYSYVENDPTNFSDPQGLYRRFPEEPDPCNSCEGSCGVALPPQKPVRLFAGFNDRDLGLIEKAQESAIDLLLGYVDVYIDKDCRTNLSAREFSGGRRIDVFQLVFTIINWRVKSEHDDESTWGPFDIINGSKSKDPGIQATIRRNPGAGGYIDGQGRGVVLLNGFFSGNLQHYIGFDMSRGIALIHEAIHLQGIHDTDFNNDRDTGSRMINTFIIQSCFNKTKSHDDLSFVLP